MSINHKLTLYVKNSFKRACRQFKSNTKVLVLLILMFYSSTFYPNVISYKQEEVNTSKWVYFTEYGSRFINTAAQVMIPLLLFDKIGMIQAINVGLATTVFTQSLKRVFNNIYIDGIRLGERPSGSDYNMPSGHSSMVTSAMTFIAIRYGFIHLIYLLPISILTMVVRVVLKAHTVNGVISGAVLGIIIGVCLSSKYVGKFKWNNLFKKSRQFLKRK